MKTILVAALVTAFAAFAWFSLPQLDGGSVQQSASGTGTVLSIDSEKSLVTVSHDALPALGMPPMTMGYAVTDRTQLAGLRPMQKVEFVITYDGKDYRIVHIKPGP